MMPCSIGYKTMLKLWWIWAPHLNTLTLNNLVLVPVKTSGRNLYASFSKLDYTNVYSQDLHVAWLLTVLNKKLIEILHCKLLNTSYVLCYINKIIKKVHKRHVKEI